MGPRNALDLALIALVYFAPLAWGSNEPWAMGLIAIGALVLAAASLTWDALRGEIPLGAPSLYVPLVLFVVYAALPLLRTSGAAEPSYPATAERHSTEVYLLLAVAYVAIVWLVDTGFRSRDDVRLLLRSLLVLGVFEALYGLVQYLGGVDRIWDYQVTADLARGTFINRNHYALLLNLSIACGVGYLYYRSARLLGGARPKIRELVAHPGAAQLAWLVLWLALIGLALVFSMSRMGIAAMFSSLAVMIVAGKASEGGRRSAILGISLLVAIVGLALYTGVDAVLARYELLGDAGYLEKDRLPIWHDAWPMVRSHLVFGQGLGSFQWTFPAYESTDPDVQARYAHNDYLQALAETGVVGLLLILAGFAAAWRSAARKLRTSGDPLARGIGLMALGALSAAALQELTDFSLYIPGAAVPFAVIVGLNARADRFDS